MVLLGPSYLQSWLDRIFGTPEDTGDGGTTGDTIYDLWFDPLISPLPQWLEDPLSAVFKGLAETGAYIYDLISDMVDSIDESVEFLKRVRSYGVQEVFLKAVMLMQSQKINIDAGAEGLHEGEDLSELG